MNDKREVSPAQFDLFVLDYDSSLCTPKHNLQGDGVFTGHSDAQQFTSFISTEKIVEMGKE